MAEGKKPDSKTPEGKKHLVSRRDFLVGSGAVIAAGALTACTPKTVTNTVTNTVTSTTTSVPPASTATVTSTQMATTTATTTKTVETKPVYAASTTYLVYDSMKCCGCMSCMGACSMVHEGEVNMSLSRIQIAQDSFGFFPGDIKMAICRQCEVPVCVQMCPTGAAHIDTANGNVRVIDQAKCIGCKTCLWACPQQPNRTVWNQFKNKSSKCDLCINTPYWNEKGGPTGKQACVESCPMHALSIVKTKPNQQETDGYDVNLRTANWAVMGLVPFRDAYYITATLSPTAGGRVAGTTTAAPGVDATITISANAGYTIKDVVVDGKSVGAVTTYTFPKISANHNVAVTYTGPTT